MHWLNGNDTFVPAPSIKSLLWRLISECFQMNVVAQPWICVYCFYVHVLKLTHCFVICEVRRLCVCVCVSSQRCLLVTQLENGDRLFDSVVFGSLRGTSGTRHKFLDVFLCECKCCTCLYKDTSLPLRRKPWPNHSCVVPGVGYTLPFEENQAVPCLLDHPACLLLIETLSLFFLACL